MVHKTTRPSMSRKHPENGLSRVKGRIRGGQVAIIVTSSPPLWGVRAALAADIPNLHMG